MEGKKCRSIVWFRRDLRVEDNPALAAAAKEGSVLPVFIWCPKEDGPYHPGRVSRWWLKQSLVQLQQSLKSLGADLVVIRAESTLSALLDCISSVGATKLVYNHLYDPISLVRDHNIKEKLVERGIDVQSYNGELLFEPWEVYDDEQPFTTFDAYWDKCLSMQKEPASHLPPWHLSLATGMANDTTIEALSLENESEKSSNALLGRGWSPGWSSADKIFNEFVEQHLVNYSSDRSRVGGNSTSLLSPYLHFGEISIWKVFHSVRVKQILWKNEGKWEGEQSAALFLKAIGLREYSRYICFNFPFTHERSLLGSLKFFPWDHDQARFKAWRQGRTGYPLVDAGMRELWATGWIHNRIRVIVSSFFVKFLLLPWQWGMKYFWDTLLDADLESDILGWQYISGGLPDGHELDRMESPQVQGFKFDPEGEYVRQWLPELARMPAEWIHHPWDAPPSVLRSAGVDLGVNYPNPVIDIDQARDRLTEAIAVMRGKEAAGKAAADEVVFDNSDCDHQTPPVSKPAAAKEKNPCPASSSHDQKVPSMRNFQNVMTQNRKRLKPAVGGGGGDDNDDDRASKREDDNDLCSTAESSSSKKRAATASRNSFAVPRMCSSISTGPVHDSYSWQEEVGADEICSKNGSGNLQKNTDYS